MNISVDRELWQRAVAYVARAAIRPGANTHMAVLAGLLVEVDADQVTLSAFDYEVSASATIPLASMGAEPARILLPGRFLADITKALPAADMVTLGRDGSRITLACGAASFGMAPLPVEDYPTLPGLPPAVGEVDASVLAEAIGQTAVAAGRDDMLPVLTGVQIEFAGELLTMAATDRYRLAVRTLGWKPVDVEAVAKPVLIAARTLVDVAKHMASGTLTVHVGQNDAGAGVAGFSDGTRTLITRLVDGEFPPYRKLLPDVTPTRVTVDVEALAAAVRRASLAVTRTAPVQLGFAAGEVAVSGGDSEHRAAETVCVDGVEAPFEVSYNPAYLLDALGAVGAPRVAVCLQDAGGQVAVLKPTVFVADSDSDSVPDYRHLLMPVRLS